MGMSDQLNSLVNGDGAESGSDKLGGEEAAQEQSVLHDEGAEEQVDGEGGEPVSVGEREKQSDQ